MTADGRPLPWYNYPAISFLEERVGPDLRVCEFGSGHSTLWWANRVRSVLSIEHDRKWHEEFSRRVPANVTYLCRPEESDYAAAITGAGPFDVVVNDGIGRVPCALRAIDELTPAGVMVWDNSERDYYAKGYAALRERGFKRIDFNGFGPVNQDPWSTTVFYRQQNCLGI